MDVSGDVLGQHRGIEFFTVGQRRGLGIASGEPRYVIRVDAEKNQVVVGAEEDLYQDRMWASRVSYTQGYPPSEPIEVGVKIRYKSRAAMAMLHPRPEGALMRLAPRSFPAESLPRRVLLVAHLAGGRRLSRVSLPGPETCQVGYAFSRR